MNKTASIGVCNKVALLFILTCAGCSFLPRSQTTSAQTIGEERSTYSYVPIDPLATSASLYDVCPSGFVVTPYVGLLPDEAVRIAIVSNDGSVKISAGPAATIGAEGHTYQVTMDYIYVDTKPIPTFVSVDPSKVTTAGQANTPATYTVTKDPDSDVWASYTSKKAGNPTTSMPAHSRRIAFPVYVGVGLRLTASITVLKGHVNLSSLGAIGASVAAGESAGSLVVQAIGVSGPKVSNLFPIVTDLNQTTIQNALVALGSIKAVMYDNSTNVVPRVVGFSNPIGGGSDVNNQIISILASDRIMVDESCSPSSTVNTGQVAQAAVREGPPAQNVSHITPNSATTSSSNDAKSNKPPVKVNPTRQQAPRKAPTATSNKNQRE